MLDKSPTDHVLEKAFQLEVRDIAEEYGWEVFCTYGSKRSPPGEPDLRLVRPPRYLTVECKTDKGSSTHKQKEVAILLQACYGIEYYLWRPDDIDEVHKVLKPDNATL